MNKTWRSINDFYFVKGQTKEQKQTPVDLDDDPASQQQKDSPEVKLIEGKWLPSEEGFQFNKKCIAQVKAEFLKKTSRKKITLSTFVEYEGEKEDLGQQVEAFLDDNGTGEADVTLFYGEKYSEAIRENPEATCTYTFKAHSTVCEKDIESEGLEMPQSSDNKLIFYIPSTDEYLEIAQDSIDLIEEEATTADDFAKEIQSIWTIPHFEEQSKKAEEVEEKLKTILGTKTQVTANDTFEELLLVRNDKNKRWGKPVSYVKRSSLKDRTKTGESGKAQFKRVKRSYEYEKKELKEFLGLEENSTASGSNNPLESVKANFWKKEAGGDGIWKFTARDDKGNTDTLSENEYFSLSAEAQLLRFAAGVSIASDVTSILKGKPKFSIGGQAHLTFSLVEGIVEGSYYFPDKKGYNILSLFISSDKLTDLVKEGRVCSILLKATLSAYTFVGANATAIIGLPNIDLTKDDKGNRNKDINAGGELGAGVTATAGGSISCTIDWKGHDTPAFSGLGEVKALAEGSGGIAGNLLAEISYENGVFKVKLGARAVLGLGGKVGSEIGLGVDEGFKFVAYICRSFDYHFVKEVLGDAFDACVRHSVATITDVQEVYEDTANKGKELVISAFNWGREKGRDIKREMVQAISKKRKKNEITLAAPEATASLILGIMTTPEEADFDAILEILGQAGVHEIKSIIRVIGKDDNYIKASEPPRGTPLYAQWQGDALRAGVKILREFGNNLKEKYYTDYRNKLRGILSNAEIDIEI